MGESREMASESSRGCQSSLEAMTVSLLLVSPPVGCQRPEILTCNPADLEWGVVCPSSSPPPSPRQEVGLFSFPEKSTTSEQGGLQSRQAEKQSGLLPGASSGISIDAGWSPNWELSEM